MASAVAELRAGLRTARASGSSERVADVQATLGATLVMDGRTRLGMAQLEAAARGASGRLLATVLMRRAYILSQLGRHPEALHDMRGALRGIRRAGDSVWEARALTNRGLIHLARGALGRAERDILRAEEMFQAAGQELEAVDALENRGQIAFWRGDIPRTLSLYDEAARRYARISPAPPELAVDRCVALMAAGLASDALEVVEQALTESAIQPRSRAELLLAAANAALAAKDPAKALIAARKARSLFRRQGREWWEMRADLVIVRARRDSGEHGRSLLQASTALGQRMHELRTDEAPQALLLAGRFAAEQGSESAHDMLNTAARYRRNPSALVRATGWLAQAVDREASGNSRGVFAACSRGLDALDEHRMTLGSSELRALATGHGEELANLALREAVLTGDARRILTWSERWRATALTQPPVRPPREARLASQLAALRAQRLHLDEVRAGSPGAHVMALEKSIRTMQHQLPGVAGPMHRFDVQQFTEELGDVVFVELLEVDGLLHAITVDKDRIRSHLVGDVSDCSDRGGRGTLRPASGGPRAAHNLERGG